jgi:hypothetical protein
VAWSFTDLRYGWKIATGIALASTTIYVANNTRWRVNQADVIELALGVDERVMALQTGTNAFGAPVYPVARLSFVRNWITNNYETQVVGGVTSVVAVAYTNTVTNTIGYRTDHAMMVELDTKLKTIVPYYVDTNTFLPLTFTGLLASLNLGDGTNFTRTPAIGTNAATYGELPWRIYVQDLQERYKVLNSLEWTTGRGAVKSIVSEDKQGWVSWTRDSLEEAQTEALSNFVAAAVETNIFTAEVPPRLTWIFRKYRYYGRLSSVQYTAGVAAQRIKFNYALSNGISEELETDSVYGKVSIFVQSPKYGLNYRPFSPPDRITSSVFNSCGDDFQEDEWAAIFVQNETGDFTTDWIGSLEDTAPWPDYEVEDDEGAAVGYHAGLYGQLGAVYFEQIYLTKYKFSYCTNKYW